MSASQPLVSVVTPVYNGEKFLAECVDSVLAQTYANWEYVIVNNRSTDRTREIAEAYARRDARIRLHNNAQFLNQMQNWNHAMRLISPESVYCKVVHADDWLFPDCLRQMVDLAAAHPNVGVVGAYRLAENQVDLDGLPHTSRVVSGREICRRTLLGELYVFGSPTSLLLRSDLVRCQPDFYDEGIIQADKKVCFDLLQESDFGFVHQVLTYTRRHNDSMTALIHSLDTRRIGRLIYLVKYGPVYLSPAEYRQRLRKALDSYYRFLARSLRARRGKAFWQYHSAELAKLGLPLSRGRLARALLAEIWRPVDRAGQAGPPAQPPPASGRPAPAESWEAVLGAIHSVEAHK